MKTVIDLSRRMETGMPVYPGDPLFQARIVADHDTDGYHLTRLTFGSHTGTHLDAPFHSFEDGETLDSFLPKRFFPSAAVLDLTSALSASESCGVSLITPEMLTEFTPVFESVECVILKTDWSSRWGTPDFYESFPSLLPETAEWMAERSFQMLGMETPSLSSLARFALDSETEEVGSVADGPIDPKWGLDSAALLHSDAECHRILLGRTPPILLLEGLTELDRLPAVSFDFSQTTGSFADRIFDLACFPLLTDRADGSPVRAAAILRK